MPLSIQCAACGEPNPAGARFCNACGRRLAQPALACPACGAENPAGARFCNTCGRRLDPRAVPAPAAARATRMPARDDGDDEIAGPEPGSSGARGGPRLLWWEIPADSLLHAPSFRALMWMRLTSEAALNALTYGMLVQIVRKYGEHGESPSRWVGLLAALVTIATVAPAALFGPIGGVAVDRAPKRLMLVLTNLARALVCFGFFFAGSGTAAIYALLVAITVITQFATPAEASVLPRVVPQERLAAANSFSNLAESGGQMLGMAILAPILMKLPGSPESLILVCGLLLTYAAISAVGVRLTVGRAPATDAQDAAPAPTPPEPAGASVDSGAAVTKPWLAGTRAALAEAWDWLAGDRAAFISMMLLVLASTANLVMVTLAPKFTREVIDVPPEFAVFVFGPAVAGMLTGLAVVPRLARRINKRRLVTTGFLLMVTVLLMFGALNGVTGLARRAGPLDALLSWGPLDHADGRLGMALVLAVPLGFAFSMVQVSAHTLLHERVPLEMQGRVFALQGAVKNATAILPLLLLGGLASLVGDVRPVMIVASLLILFLALYGGARSAQWTAPRTPPLQPAGEGAGGDG